MCTLYKIRTQFIHILSPSPFRPPYPFRNVKPKSTNSYIFIEVRNKSLTPSPQSCYGFIGLKLFLLFLESNRGRLLRILWTLPYLREHFFYLKFTGKDYFYIYIVSSFVSSHQSTLHFKNSRMAIFIFRRKKRRENLQKLKFV